MLSSLWGCLRSTRVLRAWHHRHTADLSLLRGLLPIVTVSLLFRGDSHPGLTAAMYCILRRVLSASCGYTFTPDLQNREG